MFFLSVCVCVLGVYILTIATSSLYSLITYSYWLHPLQVFEQQSSDETDSLRFYRPHSTHHPVSLVSLHEFVFSYHCNCVCLLHLCRPKMNFVYVVLINIHINLVCCPPSWIIHHNHVPINRGSTPLLQVYPTFDLTIKVHTHAALNPHHQTIPLMNAIHSYLNEVRWWSPWNLPYMEISLLNLYTWSY